MNESFEARTRGALSPYWILVDLCKMDLEDPVIRKFIKNAIPNHAAHQAALLELLNGSEEDREELYNRVEEQVIDKSCTENDEIYMFKVKDYTTDIVGRKNEAGGFFYVQRGDGFVYKYDFDRVEFSWKLHS